MLVFYFKGKYNTTEGSHRRIKSWVQRIDARFQEVSNTKGLDK
jgi:hypothetical protein